MTTDRPNQMWDMDATTTVTIDVARSPVFAGRLVDLWAYANSVVMEYSRPGKPTDNGHIESFNGTFRDECLNTHWFTTLGDAREIIEAWRREYNESRPHRALGERTPYEFAHRIAARRDPMGLQSPQDSP